LKTQDRNVLKIVASRVSTQLQERRFSGANWEGELTAGIKHFQQSMVRRKSEVTESREGDLVHLIF
jgi:hypothetical protein